VPPERRGLEGGVVRGDFNKNPDLPLVPSHPLALSYPRRTY